jgi:hypothetical protein
LSRIGSRGLEPWPISTFSFMRSHGIACNHRKIGKDSVMTTASIEQIAKANLDAPIEPTVKAQTEMLAASGNAAMTNMEELTKAYQTLATRNAEMMTKSMRALTAVKTPVEFLELQRRLIAEGVEAAVSDYGRITKLTTAVFAAAFEPIQRQVEAAHKAPKH